MGRFLDVALSTLALSVPFLLVLFCTFSHSQALKSEMPNNITCKDDSDCTVKVNGSACSENGTCLCLQDSVFVSTTTELYCLQKLNITEECTFKEQCAYAHGDCIQNVCACSKGYYSDKGLCRKEKSMIIPIAVGSVLGVLILCVVGVYLCRGSKNEN